MVYLYHLVSEEHRNLTLANCKRILKSCGLLFTVFLSPFPVFNSGLDAIITYTHFQGFNVPQFRCMTCDAKKIMKSNGFETLRIHNIEGIASFIPTDTISEIITPDKKSDFLNRLRKTSEVERRLGITSQYIVISRRIQ